MAFPKAAFAISGACKTQLHPARYPWSQVPVAESHSILHARTGFEVIYFRYHFGVYQRRLTSLQFLLWSGFKISAPVPTILS